MSPVVFSHVMASIGPFVAHTGISIRQGNHGPKFKILALAADF